MKKTLIFWYSLCQTGEFTGFLNYPTVPWHQPGRTLPRKMCSNVPCQGLAMRATTWSGTTANTLRFDRGGGVGSALVRRSVGRSGVRGFVRGGFFSRKHSDGVFLVLFFLRVFGVNIPHFNEELKSPGKPLESQLVSQWRSFHLAFWAEKNEKNLTLARRKRTWHLQAFSSGFIFNAATWLCSFIKLYHYIYNICGWGLCTKKIPYRDPLVKIVTILVANGIRGKGTRET